MEKAKTDVELELTAYILYTIWKRMWTLAYESVNPIRRRVSR